MTTKTPKFKVGDEVVLVEPSYRRSGGSTTTKTTVVKVGNKYAYVQGGWQVEQAKFDKFTGREVDAYNSTYAMRIWVPEEYEQREHRAAVIKELKDIYEIRVGKEFGFRADERYSTQTLEKLIALLKESGE